MSIPSADKDNVAIDPEATADADARVSIAPDEEMRTLKKVSGPIPLNAYLLCLAELVERLSFFGTSIVFTNFIQQPLSPLSGTGAGLADGQSGALGLGQRASTAITTVFVLWCDITPLFGGYVGDAHLGRFKTIWMGIAIRLVGHVILIVAALPGVIANQSASLGIFVTALFFIGIGTGFFQSNIPPLLGEQCVAAYPEPVVKTIKGGERVVVDPGLTISKVFMYFYLTINVGAVIGQISMTYCEKFVGYWLVYTATAVSFIICPLILFFSRKRLNLLPPSGALLAKAARLCWSTAKRRWDPNPITTFRKLTAKEFWDDAKSAEAAVSPNGMQSSTSSDWIDEVKMTLGACTVFVWFPIYWLTYNQINNNLTSQAATMTTNGIPNDVLNNLSPLLLIFLIPICDLWVYPAIRNMGLEFGPLRKFFSGFMAVVQHYVYATDPCGSHATTCRDPDGNSVVSPVNVWTQSGCYVLIAISEILAAVTGVEYAFTKAPMSMRSLVTGLFLLTSALSAALGEAFVSLSSDPLLVWNYAVMAFLSAITGVAFWICVVRVNDRGGEKLFR
ncbi:peptide transporter PTR2A [Dendrothele bispora CBS 962.96]|uniref:Peptide transporter PTR2A n=1 Tax=Dendrothele bispora (strain CBS 962.96) TaxID=1314807 RepID=A0A4S8LYJ1_DENBC|nr:peptide transporter PTR2A [Dendrothele bispora CBS 962.96]